MIVELAAWWYIEAVFRMRPHSSAAQAAFTRLSQLYVSLQGKVPTGTRGYHTLRWPAFAGRALAQAMWIYLCFAFPSDQMSRLGWPRAQDIADVAYLWTNGVLGPKVHKRDNTDAGAAAASRAKQFRKQDFLFPLPIFYLKKAEPEERKRSRANPAEASVGFEKSSHRRVHPKDLSRRKIRVVLTHSLFVQEFLRKGRGNTEYLRLRAEMEVLSPASPEKSHASMSTAPPELVEAHSSRQHLDGDDFVLYDPWLRSGASATGEASVMQPELASTARELDELLKDREAKLRAHLNYKNKAQAARQRYAGAHLSLPLQQLQDAPPYPNLALPLSMSVTHMRDTLRPLDAARPRDARCEAVSENEPLPVSTASLEIRPELDMSAAVSVQVRSAQRAQANQSKVVRPWSLPNGSLSVAAVSILGSDSKSFKAPPPQMSSKQIKESDEYFFHAATNHVKTQQAKQPTSNHEVWDKTRERLQQAVRDIRLKHATSMSLLKKRNRRTLDEIKALKVAHERLKESPNQMRESAFEVMTLRAQSDEATQKAVQHMNALRG